MRGGLNFHQSSVISFGPLKRYWMIRGHDGFETIFEMKVALAQFTENRIEQLLKALAAKTGLTYAEIFGAYATRRTKAANNLLVVHKDFPTWMCGDNPTITATIVDENGKAPFTICVEPVILART